MKNENGPTLRARFARWFIERYCPDLRALIDDRAKVMASILEMSKKLNQLKAEKEEWRQRAFSAERVLSKEIPEAFKAGVQRHDKGARNHDAP